MNIIRDSSLAILVLLVAGPVEAQNPTQRDATPY
jgi:hypothetical protein